MNTRFSFGTLTIDSTWGGTISVNSSLLISGNLSLASGLLGGNGQMILGGSGSQWTGGTLLAGLGGIFNNGTLTADTTAAGLILVGSGTLSNNGKLDVAGPNGLFLENSTLSNAGKGILNFTGDGGLNLANPNTTGTLVNTGTVEKTAGSGTSVLGTIVNNFGGTLDAESGTLALQSVGGLLASGKLLAGVGGSTTATLALASNSTTFCTGSFTGSGSGTVALDGFLYVTSAGATFNLPGGLFQWTNGTIYVSSGGTFTNAATGVLNVNTNSAPTINGAGTLLNDGTLNLAGTGSLALQDNAVLNNSRGATINFTDDANISQDRGGTLSNAGTLAKTGGSGSSGISSTLLNNAGASNVQTGSLILGGWDGSLVNGGAFTVAAGAARSHRGRGGNVFGQLHRVRRRQCDPGWRSRGIQSRGDLQFSGQPVPVDRGRHQRQQLAAPSPTRPTGVINVNTNGGPVVYGAGTLLNDGTLNVAGTNTFVLQGNAVLNNARGATLNLTDDASIGEMFGGTLSNAGTLAKTGSSGGSSTISSTFLNNGGSIQVQAGLLSLNGAGAAWSTAAPSRSPRGPRSISPAARMWRTRAPSPAPGPAACSWLAALWWWPKAGRPSTCRTACSSGPPAPSTSAAAAPSPTRPRA